MTSPPVHPGPEGLRVKQYTISPELYTHGFTVGQGPCNCTSSCCEGGVYADIRERDTILAHAGVVGRHMDDTQVKDPRTWFEESVEEDRDFPSGYRVGTRVTDRGCVFLNRNGRCVLQVTGVTENLGRWALKPLFCVLYPVEVSDGVVSFDEMLQDEQPCCSVSNRFEVPLFRACRDELVHLLGEDGYRMIEEQYAVLRNVNSTQSSQ